MEVFSSYTYCKKNDKCITDILKIVKLHLKLYASKKYLLLQQNVPSDWFIFSMTLSDCYNRCIGVNTAS